jgi:heptosyltransferase-2
VNKLLLIAGKINLFRRITTQVERYLELIRRMGLDAGEKPQRLNILGEATTKVEALLERSAHPGREIVAFAPGAHWETKTWPREHFAELISLVTARGLRPVLIGGAEDAALNADLARAAGPTALDLTGKLSIMESAAVLALSAALVTNDSAPLHLAEAVGTPVVAFFGPTVKEFGYFPRLEASRVLEAPLGCRPCSRNGARACPYGTKECLVTITPAMAFEALSGVLAKRAVRS